MLTEVFFASYVQCADFESACNDGDCADQDTCLQIDVHLEDGPMALAQADGLGIARLFGSEVGGGGLVVPPLILDVSDRVHVLRALIGLLGHDSTCLELTDIVVTEDVFESVSPATLNHAII